MYLKSNDGSYGGLGDYFGESGKVKHVKVDADAYIPKKNKKLDRYQAMWVAQREESIKPIVELEDSIYWKDMNGRPIPVFSSSGQPELLGPLTKGRKKARITPPAFKAKKIISQVRDLPVVESLAPISSAGFGLFHKEGKGKLVVLGLLLLGLCLYSKKQSV
jgi:hypothetical protein